VRVDGRIQLITSLTACCAKRGNKEVGDFKKKQYSELQD
jgi:hypothetical protein